MNKIEVFVNAVTNNPKTVDVYRSRLNLFFDVIKTDVKNYISDNRDYTADILTFNNALSDKAPMTRKAYLSTVKQFLMYNDVQLKNGFIMTFKGKTRHARTVLKDIPPKKQELKEILSKADSLEKSLFLLMAHSGLRISEALTLTLDDIDFDYKPTKITIRDENAKFQQGRVCFISNEAKRELLRWLDVRDNYLTEKKTYGLFLNVDVIRDNSNNIFPITKTTACRRWRKILRKSGHSEKDTATGWEVKRLHTLRKYFKSNMEMVMPTPILNKLVGHKEYMSEYSRHDIKELAHYYMEGVKSIQIYGKEIEPDITEKQSTEIAQLEKEIAKLKKEKTEGFDEAIKTYLKGQKIYSKGGRLIFEDDSNDV